MPLPFIPVAIGLGIGALVGAKKGYDGYSDLSDAQSKDARARDLQEKTQNFLETTKEETTRSLEELGKKKVHIYAEGSISHFITIASNIKNMPEKDLEDIFEKPTPITEVLSALHNIRVHLIEIASGALTSVGSGGFATLGALGGVQMFGAAGTGTAISAIGGIAAKNATLAWLGGGTLASGGFGVAGGMAMIGGIAVAPMLLVGGLLMASKGKKALEQAGENLSKVEAYKQAIDAICNNLALIGKASGAMTTVLTAMDDLFSEHVQRLDGIVSNDSNYLNYTQEQKWFVKNCFMFNHHIGQVVDIKLMDEEGSFIPAALEDIKAHIAFLEKMDKI